jgi:hypothetical protein
MVRNLAFTFILLVAPFANAASFENPEDVVGFEVLMADKCEHGMECMMGHTFLRMVRRDGPARRDLIFGFTTPEGPPDSIPGIIAFGARAAFVGLRLLPSVSNVASVYRSYSVDEHRDLTRIPLQMTSENKRRMLENLETIFSPESKITRDAKNRAYTYLFDNCAGLLIKLLKDSGMPNESFGIAIPMNVPAHLFRTYNALYPEIRIAKDSEFAGNFDALPEAMYQFCDDEACAHTVRATFATTWPGQEIEFPQFEKRDPEIERPTLRTRTEPHDWSGRKPLVIKHFELLRTTP